MVGGEEWAVRMGGKRVRLRVRARCGADLVVVQQEADRVDEDTSREQLRPKAREPCEVDRAERHVLLGVPIARCNR